MGAIVTDAEIIAIRDQCMPSLGPLNAIAFARAILTAANPPTEWAPQIDKPPRSFADGVVVLQPKKVGP